MNSRGGSSESIRPPRRQALMTPTKVPIANAITVVTPTRPMVHGIVEMIWCATEIPSAVVPNFPVRVLPRY